MCVCLLIRYQSFASMPIVLMYPCMKRVTWFPQAVLGTNLSYPTPQVVSIYYYQFLTFSFAILSSHWVPACAMNWGALVGWVAVEGYINVTMLLACF